MDKIKRRDFMKMIGIAMLAPVTLLKSKTIHGRLISISSTSFSISGQEIFTNPTKYQGGLVKHPNEPPVIIKRGEEILPSIMSICNDDKWHHLIFQGNQIGFEKVYFDSKKINWKEKGRRMMN